MTQLDDHGQPLIRAFNASRLDERAADELIGIAKGMLADGMIVDAEAKFLLQWMEANSGVIYKWPYNMLYERINESLSDGRLDLKEQRELLDFLHSFTGGLLDPDEPANKSTQLPFDDPPKESLFAAKSFCFTGAFAYGTRKECWEATQLLGGVITNGIRMDLHYLVIGDIGSSDWIHSTHGRKIEKAVEYRDSGCPLAIVSEEHWFLNLKSNMLNGSL
jgi:NAD-dependent DNA ligase